MKVNKSWRPSNDTPPPRQISPDYASVDTFTSEGRSWYKALSVGLWGTLRAGHIITAALVAAEKKNIQDDPVTLEFVSDPADIDAEWGRSGTDERYRLVLSGVFRLPWNVSLSSIYEYGSGQPWNRRYGYDYNGDFRITDRPEGVSRNDRNGPRFSQLDLLLSKAFDVGAQGSLVVLVEVFNLFDTVNYDVRSVDGAMYFDGPTLANPDVAFVPNPGFGTYRNTHRPLEAQIGLRWRL